MPYATKEKANAYAKAWRSANREKSRRYQKAYKAKNITTVRAQARARMRVKTAESPAFAMLAHARQRAKKRGVPCTISLEDIVIADRCPVLGIPMRQNRKTLGADSPTLDCVIPFKGYVPGNVCVISFRANRLKSSLTLHELDMVRQYIEAHSKGGD